MQRDTVYVAGLLITVDGPSPSFLTTVTTAATGDVPVPATGALVDLAFDDGRLLGLMALESGPVVLARERSGWSEIALKYSTDAGAAWLLTTNRAIWAVGQVVYRGVAKDAPKCPTE